MTGQRLREILFYFRENTLMLLAVTLPFAAAATLATQWLGEPVLVNAESKPDAVAWRSALLLCLLYPLGLGVKTLAIHRRAGNEPLLAGELLIGSLRLWPTLALVSLLSGLFVTSGVVLGVAFGHSLLNATGLMGGATSGLLVLFMLPGLWLYARVGCASIIVVAENLGAVKAMGEAWQRSRVMQLEIFNTLLAIGGVLLLVLLAVFSLLGISANGASAGADFFARGLGEWLFCLLTIAFYRFWSLLPRDRGT